MAEVSMGKRKEKGKVSLEDPREDRPAPELLSEAAVVHLVSLV